MAEVREEKGRVGRTAVLAYFLCENYLKAEYRGSYFKQIYYSLIRFFREYEISLFLIFFLRSSVNDTNI